MTRQLSHEEMDNILDFIKPQKDIPQITAQSVVNRIKKDLRAQLETQMVYTEIIPELKKEMIRQYHLSKIQAGESVGIVCAQSIGEMQTQTTLNTFHSAGASNKTMTTGVPRFRELIDATKNPKIVNNTIFFNKTCESIQEIKSEVGNSIKGLTIKHITNKSFIQINKQDENWYDSFKILYSDRFEMFSNCVTFKIDIQKMYDNKLSLEQISEIIENEYDDLFCVFSPPEQCQIDVFVDTEQITLPEDRSAFIDENNSINIYLEECVLATLENLYIAGIPAITDVIYIKKDSNWHAETNGINSKKISKQYSSFKKLLSLQNIDYTKTISNNVWDIFEVLDVEAARQFLIEEFTNVMGSGINLCHTKLLVDRMTHTGTISSITRYTLKNDEAGPCCKSSFEETLDNFLDAGAQGLVENTKGVSAAIMCGKRSGIGTGACKILIDFDMLPSESESDSESDSE
jgi:DNA-directed RNA polymerase beta' subunit